MSIAVYQVIRIGARESAAGNAFITIEGITDVAIFGETAFKRAIVDKVVAKERKKDFEISRISRFRHRTRYFTDSGIIGSKEFVATNYQRFKHLFYSKHEKKPKPIKGLDGMYSLKRLSEVI